MRSIPVDRRPRAPRRARAGAVRTLLLGLGLALGATARADDATPDEPLPSDAEFESFAAGLTMGDDVVKAEAYALRKQAFEDGAGEVRPITRDESMRLAARPAVAVEIFRDTFDDVAALAKVDAAGVPRYLAMWRRSATLMAARPKQTPASKVALAYLALADARATALSGVAFEPSAARAAGEALRANPAVAALADATWSRFLLECVRVPKAEGDRAYVLWLDEEIQAFVKRRPTDVVFRAASCRFELERGAELVEADPKIGGPMLVRGLDALGVEGAVPLNDRTWMRRYNRGVTLARLAGLASKADYRTRPVYSHGNYVRSEVPLESTWTSEAVDGDQKEWRLLHVDDAGPGATVTVWKYETTTDYVDENGKVVGGDNVGARMKRSFNDWKSQVSKVKKISPNVRQMAKGVPTTKGFEVRGKDEDGLEFRVREWYWRSDLRPVLVFNVVVFQSGGSLDRDPETDHFLESFIETPKSDDSSKGGN